MTLNQNPTHENFLRTPLRLTNYDVSTKVLQDSEFWRRVGVVKEI